MLSNGTRLGPYEILAPLGAGGMGEVYKAHDTKLGRDVAIKVLPESLAKDPDALARFEREARAVAALSDPNILGIFGFETEGEITYAVMELLEGQTLREKLLSGALPPRKVVDYGTQIAHGLAAAHEKGIIHRDLKPDNLFVTKEGRVKILDFGLARQYNAASQDSSHSPTVSAYTEPGAILGTVGYMSPEQVRGKPLDARSDIFSFGTVLYEMLTGGRAFRGETAADTMSAIMHKDPPALSTTDKEISPALDHLLRRCLEKNPVERFQTARDLAFALGEVGQPSGTTGPPVILSSRRGSKWAIAALPILLVLGVMAWFLLGRKRQAEAPGSFAPVTSATAMPANSIVVLPFANMSDDPKQQYFSNGITEELTSALGQNTGLTVIAWETASKYANSKLTPREIGKALNVSHMLGGSIEREGDQVRVSAELVSTVTGQQLWSAHYDDSLKNIFTVQDKISEAIAGALQVKFAGMQAMPTQNTKAHELYLKGLAAQDRFSATDAQTAQDYFEQALRLDRNYADAWAGLAYSYLQLSQLSTLPLRDAQSKIRAAAEKALALDPRNSEALVELGNADGNDNLIAKARTEFQQAITLDPNNAHAHTDYALVLPLKESLAQLHEAARLNPDSAVTQSNLASDYQDLSDWARELAAARAMMRLAPGSVDSAFYLAFAYTQMHRGEDAVKAFDLVQPATALDQQLVDAGRLTYQALLNRALRPQASAALEKLRHTEMSPDSQYNLIPLYLALGERETAMQTLSSMCTAAPLLCDDIGDSPVWVPLRGDPRFEKLSKRYTTITPE